MCTNTSYIMRHESILKIAKSVKVSFSLVVYYVLWMNEWINEWNHFLSEKFSAIHCEYEKQQQRLVGTAFHTSFKLNVRIKKRNSRYVLQRKYNRFFCRSLESTSVSTVLTNDNLLTNAIHNRAITGSFSQSK